MDHDPDMDPRDYQDTTGRYDGSRALLYPIPQTGSAAQDEAYARWFLHAVVARHKHLRNELTKELEYLEELLESMDDSVADRPNYTGALYLMKAIHDHQIDQIEATIWARRNAARNRYYDLGDEIYMPDYGTYTLKFALELATVHGGRATIYTTTNNRRDSLHPFVDILLEYIHDPVAMARLKKQAELPTDDSDPEFGPYMDALDGIRSRWRRVPLGLDRGFVNLHRHEAFMEGESNPYQGGLDDFGNSVVTDSAGNMLGPRGEGRIVVDVNGSAYYEPGRREPWTGG